MAEGDEARRGVTLLRGDFDPDLAGWLCQCTVWVARDVTGKIGAVSAHPNPGERHSESIADLQRFRKLQIHRGETLFDDGHERSLELIRARRHRVRASAPRSRSPPDRCALR